MKKWLTPIALLVLSAVLLVSVYVIVLAICGNNDGYAGAVYALWGIIICGVVIQPAICFAYSRRMLIDQKFRIFFTVYNSFLVSLPFFILFSLNAENVWYNPLVIFVWCELWGVLGLVKINGKKPKAVCDAGGKDEQGEGKSE